MKRTDDLILENLYQEGIFDRLKGQASGIKTGAGTLLQKAGAKIAGQEAPQKSARVEYAKSQQRSLLNSFKKKVEKEIADFNNDLKSFKVDPDPNVLEKDFPIIAQRLKEVENLKNYLSNPDQYNKSSETISPDFEVLPPEGNEEPQQKTLPSSGTRLSLPDKSSEAESDTKEANKEFLQARGSNQQQETSPSDTETQEPQQQETSPSDTETQEPVQKQEAVNKMPYGKNEYSRREDGSWIQHKKQGSRYGDMVLDPQRNRQLIQKLNQASIDFKTPNIETGSQVAQRKASQAGFRTAAERNAKLRAESNNPFFDFLKKYELI